MSKVAYGIFCFLSVVSLFFIGVSIAGEVHGNGGFIGEINSWKGTTEQEQPAPEEGTEPQMQINIADNSVIIK